MKIKYFFLAFTFVFCFQSFANHITISKNKSILPSYKIKTARPENKLNYKTLNIISLPSASVMALEYNTALGSNNTITLPLYGAVNVSIDWGDGSTETVATAGNKDHIYAIEGTYTVSILGSLEQFGQWNYPNADKLTRVLSFGGLGIRSLSGAFMNATHLTEVPAYLPDTVTNLSYMFFGATAFNQEIGNWDVSQVTNMIAMFYGAINFNQNIGAWNVSNVKDMNSMFLGATAFNQDLGMWNVSQVTIMSNMFYQATAFNQNIGTWNVSNVTDMASMFFLASSFDQNIGNWDVGNVTNMDRMFTAATVFNQEIGMWDVSKVINMNRMFLNVPYFNQNIGNWNVSQVTTMYEMFASATAFNQNISEWDVSNVTDMANMFKAASAFNQNISNWDVSQVTTMSNMFAYASVFNQSIGRWNVSNVTDMSYMFNQATSFDRDTGEWDVSKVTNMNGMFGGVTLSPGTYSNLLTGWATQNLKQNLSFDGGGSQYYCDAIAARASIIANKNWTITDGGQDRTLPVFTTSSLSDVSSTTPVTLADLSPPTATDSCGRLLTATTTQVFPINYQAGGTLVTWNVVDTAGNASSQTQRVSIAQPMILEYNTALGSNNTITLPLYGVVNVSIDWGDGSTETVTTAENKDHTYASTGTYTVHISGNLEQFGQRNYPNADKLTKVLSFGGLGITSLYGAFMNAKHLTEVPAYLPDTVTNLSYMFFGATAFNQDIGAWDVSHVTNMGHMFFRARTFNQNISIWDVANVTNMYGMFASATAFNQSIGSWDVSKVTIMTNMFYQATAFNQTIGSWDVSNVTDMANMFTQATSFDQNISGWDVSKVTNMDGMFTGVTLSTVNYTALLTGWVTQNLNPNLSFDGGGSQYNCDAIAARASIIANKNWTIRDGGQDPTLPVFTTSSLPDISSTVPVTLADLSPPTATDSCGRLLTATTTQVFPINYQAGGTLVTWNVVDTAGNASSQTQRVSIAQPMILEYNTALGSNNTITLPLYGAVNVSIDWGDGSTETVTTAGNYDHTYASTGTYNVHISGNLEQFGQWSYPNADKLTKVLSFGGLGIRSLSGAFMNATHLTEVPAYLPNTVTNVSYMFYTARAFNQDIGNWDVSQIINMEAMFYQATAFNQNIGSWNVRNVSNMGYMFNQASSFNQDISNWDVSQVSNMDAMFYIATAFNQNIGSWDVGQVNSMVYMFAYASVFNQNIGSWDVSNLTEISGMFYQATSFNQNISSWDVSKVTNMYDMFSGVTLSTVNYTALLTGWATKNLNPNVSFDGGGSQYNCDAIAARASIIANKNWTITDGGQDRTLPVFTTSPLPDISSTTPVTVADLTPPTATDSCGRILTATSTQVFPINYQAGGTLVTWNVIDAAGNTSSQTQRVSIAQPMILEYNTALGGSNNTITLPLYGAVNVTIDWGDGSTEAVATAGDKDHTYASTGTYTVHISGNLEQFGQWKYPNADKLTKVLSFGGLGMTSLSNAFVDATHLTRVPSVLPATITNLSYMFFGATSFNQNIGAWNVRNVTNMVAMFAYASVFNQNIGNWDVSQVNNMNYMFFGAIAFNQNISSWDVSKVTNMYGMFTGVTLSTVNYTALLTGWATKNLNPNVSFDGGGSQYNCDAIAARASIIANKNWTITDGGQEIVTRPTLACYESATFNPTTCNWDIIGTPLATTSSQTNISCNSGSNGSATVSATGGTAGYTYSWAPSGGIAATATGLSAGTYTVTVTDSNSCTATQIFTITEPAALVATAASQTNVSCNSGSNGSVTVNATGGTAGYTYSWAPSGGTAATATGLSAGTYTLTVTDANSCTATQSFTITEPAALVATAASQTNVSCNAGSNGSATVNATGGTAGYTYAWAPSGGTAATATGLSAGTYTVTVTDVNSCTATQSFTITQPAALSFTKTTLLGYDYNKSYTQAVDVTGGSGTKTYTLTAGSLPSGFVLLPNGTISGISTQVGDSNFTVTVTDVNNCTTSQSYSLRLNQIPVTVTATASQTKVYGQKDPVFTFTVVPDLVPGDFFTGNLTRSTSENVGSYAINQGTLSAGDKYLITYVGANFSITAKPITVTAEAKSKVYGTIDPVLTYSVSPSLVNGDTFQGSITRVTGENAGVYVINQHTLALSANYSMTFVPSTFSISKANQVITWNQVFDLGCEGETTVVLTATSNSALPVSYTSSNSGIMTVSGNTLNLLNYGTATVTASQVGNNNYNPASIVALSVVKKQPNLIRKQFEDVIFFDNSSKSFKSYTWYKNGVLVAGQTNQYYKENGPLNGTYYAIATKLDGTLITTCTLSLSPNVVEEFIKIAPNPVRTNADFQLITNVSSSRLQNARIDLFSISGNQLLTMTTNQNTVDLKAPNVEGVYIVRMTLANGKYFTKNLLVKN